jgi:hypothetical protein
MFDITPPKRIKNRLKNPQKSTEAEVLNRFLEEMIAHQQQVLLALGRRLVPNVTLDDLMQPNDFPILESHPIFRYEEGVLHGLQVAKSALLANSG